MVLEPYWSNNGCTFLALAFLAFCAFVFSTRNFPSSFVGIQCPVPLTSVLMQPWLYPFFRSQGFHKLLYDTWTLIWKNWRGKPLVASTTNSHSSVNVCRQAFDILKEAVSLSDAVLHDVLSVTSLSEVGHVLCWNIRKAVADRSVKVWIIMQCFR